MLICTEILIICDIPEHHMLTNPYVHLKRGVFLMTWILNNGKL